ncbi:MAG: S9 family peptidase [Chloroflexi bacterium]|nr:S9 family peptidase [Chloroflexota bacterium]
MTDPTPEWQRRFRAPIIGFPTWSRNAPNRIVYVSSESGIYQLHSWDLDSGERRQITHEPIGLVSGQVSADGTWVLWHRDTTGSESGEWVAAPFSGGAPEPLADGLPTGWDEGMAPGLERSVAVISNEAGFGLYVIDRSGSARQIAASADSLLLGGADATIRGGTELAGLSADETLVAVEHGEHGDLIHPALRILDARSGATIADLRDVGGSLTAAAWSPVAGDSRLAIGHERRGEHTPAVWDPVGGQLRDLNLPSEHHTEVADWWPDASALLLVELDGGRHRLHRFDLAAGTITTLETKPGSVSGARVRPDGSVWYRLQDGERPGVLLEVGRDQPILDAGPAPAGRPFIPWSFPNPHGQTVTGWRIEPEGKAPYPTLVHVHGGPTSVDLDRWAPDLQAYVDAGFQVVLVNYRGSIGFGAEWRDTLIGNIGWPEIEDINAGVDDLLARGLADPARLAIAGWSWGGYLTLLMHGMHPDRFVAGVAGVPVGDYALGYEDLSPLLQAYDRALLGGTPAEVPELMAERSPISYVDNVKAPILFLAGEADSRCPIRQVMVYVDRLRARNHPHELYLFPTGHAPFQIEERINQTGMVLDFLARHVPGIRVPA